MTRSIASLEEEEKPTEAEVIKYEKVDFDKRSLDVSERLSSVEKQLLDVVLKKDKVFEQSLHDVINEQFVYPNQKYVYLENGKVKAWQD
jgi:hypothetical protein